MNSQIHSNFNDAISVTDIAAQLSNGAREVMLEEIDNPARTTKIVSLANGQTLDLPATGGEIFILSGNCRSGETLFSEGQYLRLPTAATLQSTSDDCLLFVKYHQFLSTDNGERIIDYTDSNKWLPGPAPGINIRPLHVFDTESIMLLRWKNADEFRPNLDPQGEEILVIRGLLQHRDNLYKPYSWIRNPVEEWRSWHGSSDTLIYYKSGHFPRLTEPTANSEHHE